MHSSPCESTGSLLTRLDVLARARDSALDVETRRRRGVVHTPPALARFVVRAADDVLRRQLGRSNGLAAEDVAIVDPATGPGIFLAAALELASGRGVPRSLVGIDLDREACRIAEGELRPAALAARWPLRIAHADTLAGPAPVAELEDDDVVRVVLGNPPWAARSANREACHVSALLEDFRRDERGLPLAERKTGVLSDDYVRFMRWALELARRARRGAVVALVTNASFLDGPVHRGMRAALERWLDRIDVVDLGGSGLVARDRVRDENVFGVRPAVAITIGCRGPGPEPRRAAIRVAVLRGARDEKLARLQTAPDLEALGPTPAGVPGTPGAPWSLRSRPPDVYSTWPSLAEWMPFHREGLQTNRDHLVTDPDRDALLAKLARFAAGTLDAQATPHWDPARARAAARALLADAGALKRALRQIAYRPLDARWVVVDRALCHRPRPDLARAVDRSAFVLVSARKDRGQLPWACFGATRWLPDNGWLSPRSSCRARAFPLVDPEGAPNLNRALAARTEDRIGAAFGPDRFARWALAWMASPLYRERCDGMLRADYPRIPPPRNEEELARVEQAGALLVAAFVQAPSSRAAVGSDRPNGPALRIGHHDLGRAGPAADVLARALEEVAARVDPIAASYFGFGDREH